MHAKGVGRAIASTPPGHKNAECGLATFTFYGLALVSDESLQA